MTGYVINLFLDFDFNNTNLENVPVSVVENGINNVKSLFAS